MQVAKVHFIAKRDKKDIFGMPVLGFLFKNRYTLTFYKLLTLFRQTHNQSRLKAETTQKESLLVLGYAFAPLMIVGGLSHVLEFFFIEYYHNIVNGFSQAFGLGVYVEPLAKRGEPWLMVFRVFPFIAGMWSLHILWHRAKFLTEEKRSKVFLFASLLPIAYLLLSALQIWVMLNFPPTHRHH